MISQVRIENFYSIGDPIVVNFVRGGTKKKDGYATLSKDKKLSLVNGFWGANASGKTNVLRAIALMFSCIRGELRGILPNYKVGFNSKNTKLGIDLYLNNNLYKFNIEISEGKVINESLFMWEEVIYKRDFDGSVIVGKNYEDQLSSFETIKLDSNVVCFAIFRNFKNLDFVSDFSQNMVYFNLPCENKFGFSPETLMTAQAISIDPNWQDSKEITTQVLALFDPSIEDVDIKIEKDSDNTVLEIDIKHKNFEKPIRLEYESRGTQELFNLAYPLINILKNGGLVIYNEINKSFHPDIQKAIIDHFKYKNPKNAQIIFSSHEYETIDYLDKFQVNLVEKENDQSTYFKLSDTGIRSDLQKAKKVRLGIYGAVPDMVDFNYNLNEVL